MVNTYSNFMVFQLKNNGERIRLDIGEEEFRKSDGEVVLKSDEVIIIVKEEIRRIYIWKGIESSVRKKFIASRVAASLQKELMNEAHFHRCKIVSIDEGDELVEFLQNFGFDKEKFSKKTPQRMATTNDQIGYNSRLTVNSDDVNSAKELSPKRTYSEPSHKFYPAHKNQSAKNKKEILKKVLDNEQPSGYKRRHVLIGNSKLYGSVEKKSKIFGKESTKRDWEPITSFSKQKLELDGFKLRIYIDNDMNSVEAIEILEKTPKIKVEEKEETKKAHQELDDKVLQEKLTEKAINLTELYRLGPKTEQKFKAVGIESVNDLIIQNPEDLAQKIDGASETTIKNWIEQGKNLIE